jgi:hypothetical protein
LSTFINMELSMTLKGQISLIIISVLSLALGLSFCYYPQAVSSTGSIGARPSSFRGISKTDVTVDIEAVLRGVSIHDAGNFPVVQQPPGDTNFVSKNDGEVTQFASASRDGTEETFAVREILRYKALEPKSPYSSFQNLDDTEEILTVAQMFDRAYQGGRHVTFQTCISAEGNSSWGRLFIIAAPTPDPASLGFEPTGLAALP